MIVKKAVTKQDYAFCVYVRTCVFEVEQGISPLDDFTESEEVAVNYIGTIDDYPVATVRYQIINGDVAKIERMAVLSNRQGQGLGSKLMNYVTDNIKNNSNIKKIKLGAQNHAIPFYDRLGFEIEGDEYMDACIPHHDMVMEV